MLANELPQFLYSYEFLVHKLNKKLPVNETEAYWVLLLYMRLSIMAAGRWKC
jgi:hypothetical protein